MQKVSLLQLEKISIPIFLLILPNIIKIKRTGADAGNVTIFPWLILFERDLPAGYGFQVFQSPLFFTLLPLIPYSIIISLLFLGGIQFYSYRELLKSRN
ncbi:MAG: hypothetical protein ACXAB7_14340 [Candidatus Kariarchaeaceae archaeon]